MKYCLTSFEIQKIMNSVNTIQAIMGTSIQKNNVYKNRPISNEDLHKVLRDQFGFGMNNNHK